jgi:hypothetical protein
LIQTSDHAVRGEQVRAVLLIQLLEARGDVHDVADDRVLLALRRSDRSCDDLTSVETDPQRRRVSSCRARRRLAWAACIIDTRATSRDWPRRALSARMEESFLRRLQGLPADTWRLLLCDEGRHDQHEVRATRGTDGDSKGALNLAHHVSGLGISPTSMDPRSHITDLYVFQKPGDPHKTLLVMNINPHSPITEDGVDSESVYEFGVDNDGDAVIDVAFRFRFSPVVSNSQTASVQAATGRAAAADLNAGEMVIQDASVTFGSEPQIATAGDFRCYCGLRSDPFFADPVGAGNNFQWTGNDFFADKNVFGIVLEVPNSALGPNPHVGVWARVLVPHDGRLVQGDRAGRPGIDATFNQSDDDKRVWNQQEPSKDRELFLDKFAGVFAHAGHPRDRAVTLAGSLLPDLLTYDYSSSEGFPNGRNLIDDVINMGIALLSNGAVPHDGLRPHDDLLPDFPFLGSPHQKTA